jgi:hypothetical protein
MLIAAPMDGAVQLTDAETFPAVATELERDRLVNISSPPTKTDWNAPSQTTDSEPNRS